MWQHSLQMFLMLNTKYITSSQDTTKFIALCLYNVTQLHVSALFKAIFTLYPLSLESNAP